MGRTIAKSLDAVDAPPRLGARCVVSGECRDGRAADLAVVDRRPEHTWRGIADAGRR